ncbi:MAG TPA: GspE/PulE family protein [Candidatus Paceibacterota bacterium]|nr:GspE/PulE family protein [Candidatus Paceibacterota bacterium]
MNKKIDYTGGSVPEVVDKILYQAIESKASDVHLDPDREGFSIRFRIDGILYPMDKLASYAQDEIISRIKVVALMDIAERRFPQDGHFEFEHEKRIYNIRVSTAPAIYGEAVALRILNREDVIVNLADLGLNPEQLKTVEKISASPYGMVLVTGPTGSGKTTFLYSILSTFNKISRNIMTLEDPVEFPMASVRQIQIDENIGLGFAKSMRAVVRQDPDVIMLGEIRDADTAQMAFQASLTGILLFSTFHTFDVPGLVIRLIEMGVPRSVVAHALSGIISTRLVRKICHACAEPYEPTESERRFLGDAVTGQIKKGKGCDTCRQSGYLGRIGLFEVVEFDEEVRSGIIEGMPSSTLREFIEKKSPVNLRASAIEKIAAGITTIEEAIRVIGTA